MNPLAKALVVLGVLILSAGPATCQVPTPTRTPNPVIHLMDLNIDSNVNTIDLLLFIAGWHEQIDLNGDTFFDAKDLLLFMAGWRDRALVNPTVTPTTPIATKNQNIGTLATGSTLSIAQGDDGSYQLGRKHSYTDNGDGTITDNNTGLMWVKDPALAGVGDIYDWQTAQQMCEELSYSGCSDWRLPTIQELVTLRDAGRFYPAIAPIFASQPSYYWSSTAFANNTEVHAWVTNFYDGSVRWHEFQSSLWYIQPVRAGSPNKGARFTDSGDGTITDNHTGLMWVKDPNAAGVGSSSTWSSAIAACESLEYAGFSDWRMPNINELSSLVDYARFSPAIDPVFLGTSSFSWSSTIVSTLPGDAWDVDFGEGIVTWSKQNTTGFVRPVRLNPQ